MIILNGFRLKLSADRFVANIRECTDPSELKKLRDDYPSWFLYWQSGQIIGLPRTENQQAFGEEREFSCSETLRFLGARIADALPEKFRGYETLRSRPFTIFGKKNEVVSEIMKRVPGLPEIVSHFAIRPKLEFDVKIIEAVEDQPFLGLVIRPQTRWEIRANLDSLRQCGVNLSGLYVIKRVREPGKRRLVGKIKSILPSGNIELSESYDGISEIDTDAVWLEGSKASFSRCLKTLLGNSRYQTFEEERVAQESKLFSGPAWDELLEKMGAYVRRPPELQLGNGLTCTIGDRIDLSNSSHYKTLTTMAPVQYCFDPARTKRTSFAWSGIERFGPFSRDVFAKKTPRILVLFPDIVQGPVEKFLRAFRDGISIPNSKFAGGFGKIFCLTNPQFVLCRVPRLASTGTTPAEAYRTAISEYLAKEQLPDAALVVINNEHENLQGTDSPYLQSKALLLMSGVPAQQIRVSTMGQAPYSLQYTLQNVALALYSKMNGTPWTVDHDLTITDELVIGMGSCQLSESRFVDRQRHIGITTVFRGDGNYLLGNVSKECEYEEYPDVLKKSTQAILAEIKQRNGWQSGDTIRLVFHLYKPLKNIEVGDIVAECVKTLANEHNVEFAFLTVASDHPFVMIDPDQPGKDLRQGGRKGVYVPERGTIAQIGRYTRLVSVNGPMLIKHENAPMPAPLLVHLHPSSTYRDLTYLSEQVLKFTSLSWRSTLPAAKPVTIYYSELIAELLARFREIKDWSPAMLGVKLRASRWFL